MLAALIPGFRDIRTPLVVGYMYLVASWLMFGRSNLLFEGTDSDFVVRIRELIATFGQVFSVALVSVVAYLIGSMLVVKQWPPLAPWVRENTDFGLEPTARQVSRRKAVRQWILDELRISLEDPDLIEAVLRSGDVTLRPVAQRISEARNRAARHLRYGQAAEEVQAEKHETRAGYLAFGNTAEQNARLRAAQEATFRDLSADEQAEVSDTVDEEAFTEGVNAALDREFNDLTVMLQVERETLYQEYSRLQAEAEFRFSVTLPLILMILTGFVLWSNWFLGALILPAVLFAQGMEAQKAAEAKIWQALIAGLVVSRTLGQLAKLSAKAAGD